MKIVPANNSYFNIKFAEFAQRTTKLLVFICTRPGIKYHLLNSLSSKDFDKLNEEHRKLQELAFAEKLKELDGKFSLSEDIRGKRILLIDDMHQSGVTVWSLARFL